MQMNCPQLVSGSDDGNVKIWDLGSFLEGFGDGSATSEEQKEIVREGSRIMPMPQRSRHLIPP